MTKTFEQSKDEVAVLCKYFDTNRQAFCAAGVKEAHVRQSLIDPLFEALGWDVRNHAQTAPQYREVVPEDSVEVDGGRRAPDYAFRVGQTVKFYAEAKKCGVNLNQDQAPAHQLRRYGWNAKIPLSILTDFEEFGVYDCTMRPRPSDKASRARLNYFTYAEYPDRWREVWDVFSRDAVWSGAFDQYAAGKKKRGTSEVDAEFLKEIEQWRDQLAKNFALRNPQLGMDDLNAAVQRTIDRIVFLRMGEDRGIEPYGALLKLADHEDIYKNFMRGICKRADEKYNSGLFHFGKEKDVAEAPDTITPGLKLDDRAIKPIIKSLYYQHGSPYDFSVMPIEIIGTVYERFLGKVIRLTPSHQAKIEEKPEVRKAGGVYYTPAYIVDYIVEQTVVKMFNDKSVFDSKRDKSVAPTILKEKSVSGRDTHVAIKQKNVVADDEFVARRGALPHWQKGGSIYFVTFGAVRKNLEKQDLEIARQTLLHDHNQKYLVHHAVIMPDHVHMIIQPLETSPGLHHDLSNILKSIKGVSARKINQRKNAKGSVWDKESFDRIIRDEDEYNQKLNYIRNNPLRAGLAKDYGEYEFMIENHVIDNDKSVVATQSVVKDNDKSVVATNVNKTVVSERDTHVNKTVVSERDTNVNKTVVSGRDTHVARLKILDMACGSGSFLIGAYRALLDLYLKLYTENKPEKRKKQIYQHPKTKEWRLTIEEKKRILLDHIFGVDIDPQAVEVTKLSLLLKVLEGETEHTMAHQLSLFPERALPNLANNIKCGNSLIGPDYFFSSNDTHVVDSKRDKSVAPTGAGDTSGADTPVAVHEMRRVNPFDWNQAFPHIMKNGGFDVVIGNPPYVRQETLGEGFKEYAKAHFSVYHGMADLYSYFIEKGVGLMAPSGYFSFIVSNKWMRANYGEPLRKWLKDREVEEIVDFGDLPVFKGATTYPCIIRIKKSPKPAPHMKAVNVDSLNFQVLSDYVTEKSFEVITSKLDDKGWSLADKKSMQLLEKIKAAGVPLSEYVGGKIYRGVLTGLNEAFVIDRATRDRLIKEDPKSEEIIKPFLVGRDIKRYMPPRSDKYLIFTRRGINISEYPAIEKHLSQYKNRLMPKPKNWKGEKWEGRKPGAYKWYEMQDAIDYYDEFEKPKIIYPNICKRPEFVFDDNNLYTNQKCFIITSNDMYLLGVLNSSLTFFLFKSILPKLRGDFYEPSYVYFKDFPIVKINDNNNSIKKSIIKHVESMLHLHGQLSSDSSESQRNITRRQIEATDREIDRLVYELYGLTKDDIPIIES